MKKILRIALIVILALLILAQFVPVDRSIPEYNELSDILVTEQAPAEVAELMKEACYDCHSYETNYPWYAKVAPVSWWIQNHIEEARGHLNFSEWASYDAEKASHKLEECIEEVKEGEMPLTSYTWLHSESNLTENQKELLYVWWEETRME